MKTLRLCLLLSALSPAIAAGAKPNVVVIFTSDNGPWKLAVTPQNETMGRPVAPAAPGTKPRLYNLDQEIGEKTNLAADHPEIVRELSALAEQMNAETGGTDPAARRPAGKVDRPSCLYPSEGRERNAKPKQAKRKNQPE